MNDYQIIKYRGGLLTKYKSGPGLSTAYCMATLLCTIVCYVIDFRMGASAPTAPMVPPPMYCLVANIEGHIRTV